MARARNRHGGQRALVEPKARPEHLLDRLRRLHGVIDVM